MQRMTVRKRRKFQDGAVVMFAGRGGTIGFLRRENRVGFEINEESARKAGLKVSAKLLYLGKTVPGRREG